MPDAQEGTSARTVHALLSEVPQGRAAPAILAPGRSSMSYQTLLELVESVGNSLHSFGLTEGHRIAVVLPNGPEMAAALVAVASRSPCAPLNPRYRRPEFEFYLSDLGAGAILVAAEGAAEAETAARSLGLPVLRMDADPVAPAGWFRLTLEGAVKPVGSTEVPPEERIAILLHTSGTTSRPKLVPLQHRHLWASARNVVRSLTLVPGDRCLNIMPLFHIHGIVACLLATLASGGTIACTDGVFSNSFFGWLEEFQPTWFSAVPAMHQAIVRRAAKEFHHASRHSLRFIRSSSASLAPTALADIERAFSVPVVEAYGMTEAAHQVASNPLPPGLRKPGSVGMPTGLDIGILGEDGRMLDPGQTGEVVICGENVFAGYERNEEANRGAFVELEARWFRTGDLGRLDADGYLELLGRIKEQINRGGEKISPREIDEVLMRHPSVAQAVAFSVPHRQLGEDVGAAVVLKAGSQAGERELRAFAATELADFKVPRIVRFLEELPKGPTGKIQRIGLASALGVGPLDDTVKAEDHAAARNQTEARLISIWRQVLGHDEIGVRDQFTALGGDSLLAVRMLAAVRGAFGVESAFPGFLLDGTVESLARELDGETGLPGSARIVPLSRDGDGSAVFCAPGHNSSLIGLSRLARMLAPTHHVHAAHYPDYLKESATTVEQLGTAFAEDIQRVRPSGQWYLVGYCFGGLVALEAARRIRRSTGATPRVVLIDTLCPQWRSNAGLPEYVSGLYRQLRVKVPYHLRAVAGMEWSRVPSYVADRADALLKFHGESGRAAISVSRGDYRPPALPMEIALRAAGQRYRPEPYDGPVLLLRMQGRRPHVARMGWGRVLPSPDEVDLPFYPYGALAFPVVRLVADVLRGYEAHQESAQ